MTAPSRTIRALRAALAAGSPSPSQLAEAALANSNRNAGRNTYIWQDPAWTRAEAARAEAMAPANPQVAAVHSVTAARRFGDCRFRSKIASILPARPLLAASISTAIVNGKATRDSWLVEQLRAAGAVIVGKTHLHPLAYGITGENPEFGDCVQPRDPGALTGGSSSGAAASVQEGSAVAAIGTDTGGSVRAPAALCGLAGYRATLGRGDWRGGAHLAESFDTMGWLFRDLEDAPFLAAPFAPAQIAPARAIRPLCLRRRQLSPRLRAGGRRQLSRRHSRLCRRSDLQARTIDTDWWADAVEIFAPIQASEAARLHAGNFDRF